MVVPLVAIMGLAGALTWSAPTAAEEQNLDDQWTSSTATSAASIGGATSGGTASDLMIVTLRPSPDPRSALADVDEIPGVEVRDVFDDVLTAAAVSVSPGGLAQLSSHPSVASVEPDVEFQLQRTVPLIHHVVAPRIVSQASPPWGLDRIDQRNLPVNSSYKVGSNGAGVRIYVLDSGVSSHAEFGSRVLPGASTVNDGLGSGDCNGHGTHVAATAAGTTAGVAKGATVVPVRVFDCQSTTNLSAVLAGLEWISQQHSPGAKAVVNLSIGGSASTALDNAVAGLVNQGIVVVVAAGNDSTDACSSSPGRIAQVITVGATNASDVRPSWSNGGSCIDIHAPGVQIWSATHTGGYMMRTGTSMASPHVAGAAALRLAQSGGSPASVMSALVGNATVGVLSNVAVGSPNRLLFVGPEGAPTAPPSTGGVTTPVPGAPTGPSGGGGVSVVPEPDTKDPSRPGFSGVTPGRVFDSRGGALVGSSVVKVKVAGRFGVPSSGVGAVALNVTALGSLTNGFVVAWQCGVDRPPVSSVNFVSGRAVANGLVVPVGASGEVCLWASTPVHVIGDVSGWFAA